MNSSMIQQPITALLKGKKRLGSGKYFLIYILTHKMYIYNSMNIPAFSGRWTSKILYWRNFEIHETFNNYCLIHHIWVESVIKMPLGDYICKVVHLNMFYRAIVIQNSYWKTKLDLLLIKLLSQPIFVAHVVI